MLSAAGCSRVNLYDKVSAVSCQIGLPCSSSKNWPEQGNQKMSTVILAIAKFSTLIDYSSRIFKDELQTQRHAWPGPATTWLHFVHEIAVPSLVLHSHALVGKGESAKFVVHTYLLPTSVTVSVRTSLIWAVHQTLFRKESGYTRLPNSQSPTADEA